MPKKPNKLSQLIFRRSSTKNEPIKPSWPSSINYQHRNQSHYDYENLMGFGLPTTLGRDYEKEEDAEDENAPLIPIAIPQLVENKRGNSVSSFGRVVIFADKSTPTTRARSCSPSSASYSKTRINGDGRPQSILKNSSTRSKFYEHIQNQTMKEELTVMAKNTFKGSGKSTLQRTKSSPDPSSLKRTGLLLNRSIPVPIPSPPKLLDSSIKLSRSNPLLNVSWNCPTLEKRKEVILKYFKSLGNNKQDNNKQYETEQEPIYEEICDRNKFGMDSLKPKLSPKKVRLNLLPTYANSCSSDENLYQQPVYHKIVDRSSSFCSSHNNWGKCEDSSNSHHIKETISNKPVDSDPKNLELIQMKMNRYTTSEGSPLADNQKTVRLGLANFASQVAQQAKTNLSNKTTGRSCSFSFGELKKSTSSNNFELDATDSYQPAENSNLTCDMDEIYLRLDKRGRKFGSPTTRLLKRHQSQNFGKSLEGEDFYINRNSTAQSSQSHSIASDTFVSTFDAFLQEETPMIANSIYTNVNTVVSEICEKFDHESFPKTQNVAQNKEGDEVMNKNLHKVELSTNSAEDSEAESGLSMDSVCEEDISPQQNNNNSPISASEDSCYSCTNSSNSSSSEEESESRQLIQQRFNPTQHPPVRPPRATTKAKPVKKIALSQNSDVLDENLNSNSTSIAEGVEIDTSNNFITNVSVDKELPKEQNSKNHTGFINLADIDSQIRGKSVLTISVIDSTQSTPTSYPYPLPIEEKKQKESEIVKLCGGDNINCDKTPDPFGCLNWEDWYKSLQRGTVHSDDSSVLVTHQTPKIKGQPRNSSPSTEKSGTDYCTHIDSKLKYSDSTSIVDSCGGGRLCEKSSIEKPQDNHFSEEGNITEFSMSASTLMTPTTSMQDDKLRPPNGLLIETQNLWDTSLSPTSSTSPTSHSSSEPDLSASSSSSTTTTSDLSIMTDSETRNQFIHQDSKYYEDADVEEDGGFESFQVLDADGGKYEDYDDERNSQSDDGQFLGISDSTASRQRTFAQLSQNIPEQELKQKASSVLDLINAEISDLHMRELELKKKNLIADGKHDYENDSEDLVEEGSSADSDDYSDSAVDMVEAYSNSSGNVTPADREKSQERERAESDSPHSLRGSYHPAKVEEKQVVEVQAEVHVELLTSSTSSLIVSGSADEVEVPSSGTTTAGKQVGVKVRPIVEEEVRSIELNVERETPIEREIRLVREREEEFRRQRIASSGISVDSEDQSLPTSPVPVNEKVVVPQQTKLQEEPKKVGAAINSLANAKSVFNGGSTGPKDIQYEMATARLKREMEENLMRERELFQEGRLKSLSAPEPTAEVTTSEESPFTAEVESENEAPNNEEEEDIANNTPNVFEPEQHMEEPKFIIGARRALVRLPSAPVNSKVNGPQPNFQTSSVAPHSAPAVNSMRFFSPSGFSPPSPHSPQSLSFQRGPAFSNSAQTQSLSFSKPQFTSIERMILKGSFAFNKNTITEEPQRLQEEVRMTKVSLMPDPLQIVHRTESIDETEEGDIEQEEVKPRRKYVPAQDKIQKELQEQSKREKELSQLRAKCKSTPDLSKSDDKFDEADDADSLVDGEGLTKPSSIRGQLSSSTQKLQILDDVTTTDVLRMNKPTVRRRHSALINQWEEMIKQQASKNSKN